MSATLRQHENGERNSRQDHKGDYAVLANCMFMCVCVHHTPSKQLEAYQLEKCTLCSIGVLSALITVHAKDT